MAKVKVKYITGWLQRKPAEDFVRETGEHLVIEKSFKYGRYLNGEPRTMRVWKFVQIIKGYTMDNADTIDKKEIHHI